MTEIAASGYPVFIGNIEETSFSDLLDTAYPNAKKVVIVDENTHDECLEYLITTFKQLEDCEVVMIPAGEENKVLEICFQVWEALSEYRIGRRDLVINLGGGLVSDIGGFIASVYKRGVDFINIPTSLLAMVDASVGGKTGIDLGPYKNQLGTFSNPKAVFIDTRFLSTLPGMELLNGYAEMLKHALIADKEHWAELCKVEMLDTLGQEALIARSVGIKNDIVKQDPLEKDLRKKLNFGHTAGHALEGFFLQRKKIAHGHAVALGMLVESFISYRRQMLTDVEWAEIENTILSSFPLLYFTEENIEDFIRLIHNDKKNYGGQIHTCLLEGIGKAKEDVVVEEHEFVEAFIYLNINLN